MIAAVPAAAYCVAMALASRLVPLCPCCGTEVKISRLVAAVAWVGVAGALFVLPGQRFRLYGAMALLSVVQAANFWQQFRHDEMSPSSVATWTFGASALGAVSFGVLARLARPKAGAR